MKILICGLGSIGRKHYENLKLMGIEADICDPKILGAKYKDIYELGIHKQDYDLVIIATPTEKHIEHLHYFNDRGYPYIMLEKPLYRDPLTDFPANFYVNKPVRSEIFVNHAYRFERGLRKLKELVNQGIAGKIRHVNMENSYSFDKLHPQQKWEDYDGIIFDDSHIINTSRFLFGEPISHLNRMVRKDLAEFTWVANDGVVVSHRTDVLGERYKKRIEVKGEKGTLIWNLKAHEVFFAPKDESERRAIPYKHACHLFEALKYVIETVRQRKKFYINDIFDSIKDMEVIECLRK